jgi:hypothetical protein
MWMLIAAAVATAMAIAAVITGQRRSNLKQHSLSGSVARRMSLFSTMAGTNMGSDRPARRVETTVSHDDYVQRRAYHGDDAAAAALV